MFRPIARLSAKRLLFNQKNLVLSVSGFDDLDWFLGNTGDGSRPVAAIPTRVVMQKVDPILWGTLLLLLLSRTAYKPLQAPSGHSR